MQRISKIRFFSSVYKHYVAFKAPAGKKVLIVLNGNSSKQIFNMEIAINM